MGQSLSWPVPGNLVPRALFPGFGGGAGKSALGRRLCSWLSDSVPDAKVKGKRKVGGAGKRKKEDVRLIETGKVK